MPRRARARAHAALGVVNAIGSGGYGAAVALDLWTSVEAWECSGFHGASTTRGERLGIPVEMLEAVAGVAGDYAGKRLRGLCASAESDIPLEAGLKGSSALVNALLLAALRLAGAEPPGLLEAARLGVEAARRAGLTVTGALDDHLATLGCGGYATVNPRTLAAWEPGLQGYAVVLLRGRRSIREVRPRDYAASRSMFRYAWSLAVEGAWWAAAFVNGVASLHAAGEPVSLLEDLLAAAETPLAAGVTGKGPNPYLVVATHREAVEAARRLEEKTGYQAVIARILQCQGGV